MPNKPAHKTPKFKKALAELQSRWPDVKIFTRDRVKYNATMKKINSRARKKRKKAVAT